MKIRQGQIYKGTYQKMPFTYVVLGREENEHGIWWVLAAFMHLTCGGICGALSPKLADCEVEKLTYVGNILEVGNESAKKEG